MKFSHSLFSERITEMLWQNMNSLKVLNTIFHFSSFSSTSFL
jgi:hypothetical protein